MTMYFFPRIATDTVPAGVTVSRLRDLPAGDFQLDEFEFADGILWFVREHNFSPSEREKAAAHLRTPEIRHLYKLAFSHKEPA